MHEPITPYDLEPTRHRTAEEELWLTVLELFLKDAIDMLIKEKPNDYQAEAFNDLIRAGAITRRLAKFNNLDPEWVSRHFRLYVQQFYMKQAA
mgnify:CR=1 FL=1